MGRRDIGVREIVTPFAVVPGHGHKRWYHVGGKRLAGRPRDRSPEQIVHSSGMAEERVPPHPGIQRKLHGATRSPFRCEHQGIVSRFKRAPRRQVPDINQLFLSQNPVGERYHRIAPLFGGNRRHHPVERVKLSWGLQFGDVMFPILNAQRFGGVRMRVDPVEPEYFQEGTPIVSQVVVKIDEPGAIANRIRDQTRFGKCQRRAQPVLRQQDACTLFQ